MKDKKPFNAKEHLKERAENKTKKVQTILGVDATNMFYQIESSAGKIYWWSIQQFEKDILEGTKTFVKDNDSQFTSNGTDFSKLVLA